MKALTICQPYAHLIAIGQKWVENRTWPTSYRGLVAIHAGRSRSWLDEDDEAAYPDMAFGAVVAVATLADCRRFEELPDDLQRHDHALGPWCWVMRDVRRLSRPVAWRGAQGLWDVPGDLRRRIDDPSTSWALSGEEAVYALAFNPWGMDDSDYRVLDDRFVTTRRPSKCTVCFAAIPVGSRVRARTETLDGKCMTFKFCPECCWCMAHRDDDSAHEPSIGMWRMEHRYEVGRANADHARAQ